MRPQQHRLRVQAREDRSVKKGWSAASPDQNCAGIRDGLEFRRGLDPGQADQGPGSPEAWVDTDGDGFTDTVERKLGTVRWRADTDGDGFEDGLGGRAGMPV